MPSKSLDEFERQVGHTMATVENLVVKPRKVEEFSRVVKDDNPAFRDEEAAHEQNYETIPTPLTLLGRPTSLDLGPTESVSTTDSISDSTSPESSTANRSTSTNSQYTPTTSCLERRRSSTSTNGTAPTVGR